MDNTPSKPKDHKQQSEGAVPASKEDGGSNRMLSIENLTKVAGAAVIACYAIGLLEVNAYLLPYGVSDFNLFRARFIFTGLLAVGTILFSICLPLIAVSIIVLKRQGGGIQRVPFLDPFIKSRGWFMTILYSIGFISFPLFLFNQFYHLTIIKSLEGYLFNVLLGGILIFAFYLIRRYWKKRESFWTSFLVITVSALVIVQFFSYVTYYFSANVFPNVPVQLGGTRGQLVQLLIKHDSVAGIRQLGVPMEANLDTTKKVRLLFTGENFYLISYNKDTFVLMSDAIAGINPEHSP